MLEFILENFINIILLFWILIILILHFFLNIRQKKKYYKLLYFDGLIPVTRKFNRCIGKYKYSYIRRDKEYTLDILPDMENEFNCYILECDEIIKKSPINNRIISVIRPYDYDILHIKTHNIKALRMLVNVFLISRLLSLIILEYNIYSCIITILIIIFHNYPLHKKFKNYTILNIKHNGFRKKLYIVNE